jgi:hypothetical protein
MNQPERVPASQRPHKPPTRPNSVDKQLIVLRKNVQRVLARMLCSSDPSLPHQILTRGELHLPNDEWDRLINLVVSRLRQRMRNDAREDTVNTIAVASCDTATASADSSTFSKYS